MSAAVIVDDQDARVNYTGKWTLGNSDMSYSQTSHTSQTPGSSLTFDFQGSSVSLYGSYSSGGSCSAMVSLDGQSNDLQTPNVTTILNNQVMWTYSEIVDSNNTHIFSYTVTGCQGFTNPNATSSSYPYFSVDYILFSPFPTTDLDGSTIYYDDTNPNIHYSGSWNSIVVYNVTLHGGIMGAELQFQFNGTSVAVYTVDGNSTSSGSFTIDNGSPSTLSSPNSNQPSSSRLLYKSKILDDGQHTLNVTSVSAGPLWIDYIVVQNGGIQTAPNDDSESYHKALSTRLIVGIIVGVIAVAGMVLGLWFRYRRKSNSRLKRNVLDMRAYDGLSNVEDIPLARTPTSAGYSVATLSSSTSIIPQVRSHARTMTAPSPLYASSSTSTQVHTAPRLRRATITEADEFNSAVELKNTRLVQMSPTGITFSEWNTYQPSPSFHTDSGIRIDFDMSASDSPQHVPDDLPPVYTPK